MTAGQWYTLIRFHQTPDHLTGVAEACTAQEALQLLDGWAERYPADTTRVFTPEQRPIERAELEYAAAGLRPPRRRRMGG
jgi:hypothetical protein